MDTRIGMVLGESLEFAANPRYFSPNIVEIGDPHGHANQAHQS